MPAIAAVDTSPRTGNDTAGITLPVPLHNIDPLSNSPLFHFRQTRLYRSSVPGAINDAEAITVAVGPDGTPSAVTDRQQLVLHGKAGPYLIYELGPAREVEGLNDFSLPTVDVGQVVWQGFSPGTRSLVGLLTLDPAIEAARLPLSVGLTFHDSAGHQRPLLPGARAPDNGTIEVTLTNQTSSPRIVDVGTGDANAVASVLDTLLDAAKSERAGVPPYAGNGLPKTVAGTVTGQQQIPVTAPLRVRGSIGVVGSTGSPVTGLGTTQIPGGATVFGTLNGGVTFDVAVTSGQQLSMSLDVQPWLDPRSLEPPSGDATWTQWAARGPSDADRAQATGTMIEAAAQAALADFYSPYLQTNTNGTSVSTFHYTVAAAPTETRRAGEALTAKPGAITAAVIALVAIAGNAALLRRRW